MSVFNSVIYKHIQVSDMGDDIIPVLAPAENMIITGLYIGTSDPGPLTGLLYTMAFADDDAGSNSFLVFKYDDAIRITWPVASYAIQEPFNIKVTKPYLIFTLNAPIGTYTTIYIMYRVFSPSSSLISNSYIDTLLVPPTTPSTPVEILTGPTSGAFYIKSIIATSLDTTPKPVKVYITDAALGITPILYSISDLGGISVQLVDSNPFYLTTGQSLLGLSDSDNQYNLIITYTLVN